jgi:hypothetical protein
MIKIKMRVVRLITFLYGVWNLIVMIFMIDMVVIINIDIKENLVIIIPLGVIIMLNTPVKVVEIENEKLVIINRSERVGK